MYGLYIREVRSRTIEFQNSRPNKVSLSVVVYFSRKVLPWPMYINHFKLRVVLQCCAVGYSYFVIFIYTMYLYNDLEYCSVKCLQIK